MGEASAHSGRLAIQLRQDPLSDRLHKKRAADEDDDRDIKQGQEVSKLQDGGIEVHPEPENAQRDLGGT